MYNNNIFILYLLCNNIYTESYYMMLKLNLGQKPPVKKPPDKSHPNKNPLTKSRQYKSPSTIKPL